LDDGGPDLPTAVLRYLGSLPQSIGKDIELPLPQNPDEELLVLFARENISVARQNGYHDCISLPLVETFNRLLETTPPYVCVETRRETYAYQFETTKIWDQVAL
jgi:hypothetical protein